MTTKSVADIWNAGADELADIMTGARDPDPNALARAKLIRWTIVGIWVWAIVHVWPTSKLLAAALTLSTVYTVVTDSAENRLIKLVRDRKLLVRRPAVTGTFVVDFNTPAPTTHLDPEWMDDPDA